MSTGSELGSVLAPVMLCLATIFIGTLFIDWLYKSGGYTKAYTYRKFITSLFVAGKVRQIADKEKVNLDKEYINYLKWEKNNKNRLSSKDLDDAIERQLNEKLEKEA
jgi:hypothetical protein